MIERPHIGILNTAQLQQGAGHLSAAIIGGLVQQDRWRVTIFNQDASSPETDAPGIQTVLLPGSDGWFVRSRRSGLAVFNRSGCPGRYAALRRSGIDLLVATPTASLAGIYAGVPYIGSIADMMHEFYPEFPEFPLRTRIARHFSYTKSATRSLLMVADSDCGRGHLTRFLGIPSDRTHAAPFIPPPHIFAFKDRDMDWAESVTSEFNLPKRFLFYPAQFWSHKNHIRLIRALRRASQAFGSEIYLVLAGSKRESFDVVQNEIRKLGLESQVRVLGYVRNDQLVALYKLTTALVFPSLFGPTNIPIAEAIVLGVPLACSNLFAMPEQVGGAGLLFDPFSESDMADKIAMLWSDDQLRMDLQRRCAARAAHFSVARFARDWSAAVDYALVQLRIPSAGRS